MKGKHFVEVVNNTIVAQGQVEEQVGPGLWALRFAPAQSGLPSAVRIIPAQNMQALMLFDTPEDMLTFVRALAERGPAEPAVEMKALADMTKAELTAACEGLGVEIPSKASKAQLIALIEEHSSNQP